MHYLFVAACTFIHFCHHRIKFGRRVIVYQMWDAEKYPYRDIMNMFYVICVTLAREPKTQLSGITLIGDMKGMTRKHVPSNWTDFTAWSNFMKGGAPVFFHQIHLLNYMDGQTALVLAAKDRHLIQFGVVSYLTTFVVQSAPSVDSS